MKKPGSFFLFPITVLCLLTCCSHSIKVDVTRQSSELNHCEYIFGTDLNTLKFENAILLQTGVVDTTDEQPPIPVAIVIIDKKEVILKLLSQHGVENDTSRIYKGEGYTLDLTFKKQIAEHNETIFNGKFVIEYKGLKSEYHIEGTLCNL